jgi:hypothetical protein
MSNSGFVCEKCNRIFKLKHHLKAHLEKKNSCSPLQNKIKFTITQNNALNDTSSCSYCNRDFKRKWDLIRHLKICKIKEKKDEDDQTIEQLKDKMKFLEIENVRLKTENEHLKKYNELIDVVKKLKEENNN